MKIASELRVARVRRGLSQEKLADVCGLYQERVSRVERGCAPVDPDEAQRLAAVLGYDPEELFSSDGRAR